MTPEIILSSVWSWFQSMPAVTTLIMLQGLDILSGLFVALSGSNLSSAISWRGMAKKGQMLIMVTVGLVAEPMITEYFPKYPLPLASIIAGFFILTEIISIIENASLMGLPVPKGLVDKLVKMSQDAGVATAPPAAAAKVEIQVSTPAEPHEQTNAEAIVKKKTTQKITVPLPLVLLSAGTLIWLTSCTLRFPIGEGGKYGTGVVGYELPAGRIDPDHETLAK